MISLHKVKSNNNIIINNKNNDNKNSDNKKLIGIHKLFLINIQN